MVWGGFSTEKELAGREDRLRRELSSDSSQFRIDRRLHHAAIAKEVDEIPGQSPRLG